jgi:hypothetical protein
MEEAILMIKRRSVLEGIFVFAIGTVCAFLVVNVGMLLGWQVEESVNVVSVVHTGTITNFTNIIFKDGGSYMFYGYQDLGLGNHSFRAHYGWWDQLILDTYS